MYSYGYTDFFDNIAVYNNSGHGIYFETYSYVNRFNNLSVYNNAGSGLFYTGVSVQDQRYYGTLKVF